MGQCTSLPLPRCRIDLMSSHPKHATAAHDILDLIRHRWSPRAFDPGRDVSAGDLRIVFEAARWAPSSYNEQPWRFIVAERRRTPEAFSALLGTIDSQNRDWARHAPVLVLVAASTRLTRTARTNQSAWYDTGQAVGFLTLQATGLGLAIRQMEGFDHAAARAVCAIPPDFEPVVAMAIGYAGDPDLLATERQRDAERQPRRRQPVEEFVFEGTWGKTLTPAP
jgi:nitroreductase